MIGGVNPFEIRWDCVTVHRAGGFYGRLLYRGEQLWSCGHRHRERRAARTCAFRAWQLLGTWLDGREEVAA